MTNLKQFERLDDAGKKAALEKLYNAQNKSWEQIAADMGTYANKIRRLAVKLGIKSKTQSEAQSNSLKTGRRIHPTAGKERSEDTKLKISESQAKAWENLTPQEREERAELTRQQYNGMTPKQKINFLNKATEGRILASKEGSKLEKYLFKMLKTKYPVQMHKEQHFVNERLHIDLYISKLNISIEVDGPSHFAPIWGEENLKKKKKSDREKNGLILGAGGCLIRIKHDKEVSEKRKRDIYENLLDVITRIEKKYPDKNNRFFEI